MGEREHHDPIRPRMPVKMHSNFPRFYCNQDFETWVHEFLKLHRKIITKQSTKKNSEKYDQIQVKFKFKIQIKSILSDLF